MLHTKFRENRPDGSGEEDFCRVFTIYEGCPKMPYNCIISLKFKTSISLIHIHPVENLFLDILLKLHKIS